jgi:hypothetical protein
MIDDFGKSELVERICDAIVQSYDRKSLENIAWDMTYEELMNLERVDLRMYAEDYGVG